MAVIRNKGNYISNDRFGLNYLIRLLKINKIYKFLRICFTDNIVKYQRLY